MEGTENSRVFRIELTRNSHSKGSHHSNVGSDTVRQRALQATEYYLHKVRRPSGEAENSPEGQSAVTDMDSSAETEDALRAGVTPASSDAYYKAKLRAGFIDLRNSYNEKIRPRTATYPNNRQLGAGPPRDLSRVTERTNTTSSSQEPVSAVPKSLTGRKELYRSNSSLELDRFDNATEKREAGALHRDYGSASSLDMIGSNSSESFFAMVKGFPNENRDQRAPPPPEIQEVLRGKVDYSGNKPMLSPNGQVPNGLVPTEDVPDGSHSPKLKKKKVPTATLR